MRWSLWSGALLMGLALAGCGHPALRAGPAGPPVSAESLKPDAAPPKQADLLLAGTPYPVNVAYRRAGPEEVIQLVAHGETFESERYLSRPDAFSLEEAAEESCRPPLPLLQFPMHAGDGWTWSGFMTSAGISRKATASVSTRDDRIYYGGAGHDAVEVSVAILLYADPSRAPLKRDMEFWFAPGEGVVRRKFGSESIRQPHEG